MSGPKGNGKFCFEAAANIEGHQGETKVTVSRGNNPFGFLLYPPPPTLKINALLSLLLPTKFSFSWKRHEFIYFNC